MESISLSALVSAVAIITFIYTYVKDRYESGKAIGKLEERVATLERDSKILEQLAQTLTETRLTVVRLEQKVDSIADWINKQ
jgi:uncharacterized coiled-coil protein SlyX